MSDFSELLGKTLTKIDVTGDQDMMTFVTDEGRSFSCYHSQDCCENVRIEEVIGDLSDLVGSPILRAEERSDDAAESPEVWESGTWTFYELATVKGSVTIRWLGTSNGYYSEGVDFSEDNRA